MEFLSITVHIDEFEEGPQTIMVSAFDFDGEVLARVQSNILIDRVAPRLSIQTPADPNIRGAAPFDISVDVFDIGQPVLLSGRIGVLELDALPAPPYVFRVDPRDIGAGPQTLELQGTDRAGNIGRLIHPIRLSFCEEDATVRIPGRAVAIDVFENSRPDATADDPGEDDSLTCSQSGKLPWSDLNYFTASEACATVGKRLCTPEEWRRGCEGFQRNDFPYGARWNRTHCNGQGSDLGGELAPTGDLEDCRTAEGVHDLSGNLAEWTSEDAIGRGVNGGHYRINDQDRLRCDSRELFEPNIRRETNGFRCCLDLE